MKTLNNLKIMLVALISVVSMNFAQAQCPTTITSTDYGNGAYAFNSDGSGSVYLWDFGDGNTSSQTIINQYQYVSPGSYLVCLTIDGCQAICDSVVYSGSSPCTAIAGFTYVDNGNGNYSFTNTSTGTSLDYSWDFGDGSTSMTTSPTHTYAANGTYVVQVVSTDPINSCYDYYYTTIQVSGIASPTSCNAAFVIVPDSSQQGPGSGSIIVFNTSTGSNLTYFWNFGDGNTSNQQYPGYSYATAGPFDLCLTVDNGNGCSSTFCDSIGSNGIVFKGGGFTINVDAPVATGIETQNQLISDVDLYPNPVKNNLTISLNLTETSNVEVFVTDMLGNKVSVVANQLMNSGTNQINWKTNDVPNGIYLLNIRTENSLEVKKLIVNK